MRLAVKIQSTINLLDNFFESSAPFDIIMAKYFRSNKWIGSHERREIAEFCYSIFRKYETINFLTSKITNNFGRFFVLTYLRKFELICDDEINTIFSGKKFEASKLTEFEWKFINSLESYTNLPRDISLNYPNWMELYFERAFPKNFKEEMLALNEKACVDLRVNTLKSSKDEVVSMFSDFSIEKGKLSENCIRILNGRIGRNHLVIKNGFAEIQDEGSQLIAEICTVSSKDTIVDFCAGAGGKTLAIAAAMNNRGRIFALDKYSERLENAKLRFRRAGVNNVMCQEINSKWLKRHKECADIVLVDAPCSGTGTWRRNPDMRAKFQKKDLDELIEVQAKILETASTLVKRNGRLIYSTCSVLLEENDDQIECFLRKFRNFGKIRLALPIKENVTDGYYLRLSPFRNGTDGFFAACLERFE